MKPSRFLEDTQLPKVVNYSVTIRVGGGEGYFEHDNGDEEFCGRLWFDVTESGDMFLSDYDGVMQLPRGVAAALVLAGIPLSDCF